MSTASAADTATVKPRRGGVKFLLIHHGACTGGRYHFRVAADGQVSAELDESELGQHPRSIAVVLDGDFESAAPNDIQMAALHKLTLSLKLRYPDIEVGAHRQVRGEPTTTCPGRRFPMKAFADWSRNELLRQRDEILRRDFEAQYSQI